MKQYLCIVKVLTVILALLVVVLSVAPCCVNDNCTNEEVTAGQRDSHKKDVELCSPFYSCSSCIGFTWTHHHVEEPATLLSQGIIHFAEYKQSSFIPYHHAIWQPPKVG